MGKPVVKGTRIPYRKPNPNMITGLADKHFVDVKQSVLIGDTEIDQQIRYWSFHLGKIFEKRLNT